MNLSEALSFYPRANKMLEGATLAGVDQRYIVLVTALCARRALKFVPRGELRPLQAIEAAEAWAKNPTEKNRRAAEAVAETAWAAGAPRGAAQATWAVEAAAWAARAAARAAWAAPGAAVVEVAQAAAAAADAATAVKGAYNKEMRAMANIVRWSSVIWICDTRDYIKTYTPRLP